MRKRVKKQSRVRKPHTKRWGEWEDEEIPKRGIREMTPLERSLKK